MIAVSKTDSMERKSAKKVKLIDNRSDLKAIRQVGAIIGDFIAEKDTN